MDYAIVTQNISKIYNRQRAVDNVNIQVPKGCVYGYLGANGAGKTTTIRLLLNLLKPDSGSIEILGNQLLQRFYTIAPQIGNVPGEVTFYEELTGIQMLDYMQGFLKVNPVLRRQLLSDFKFAERDLNKKMRQYSQGMKQKILLIQAMQHNPDLIILDEPSEKLDPLMQNVFYDYIFEFRKQGKTVFLSSHNLPEVEKVCDYIGIIKNGKLLVQDKIDELKKKLPRLVKLTFNQNIKPEDFRQDAFSIVKSGENSIDLKINGPLEPLMKILQKYDTYNLEMPESPLESYFMDFYKTNEGNG